MLIYILLHASGNTTPTEPSLVPRVNNVSSEQLPQLDLPPADRDTSAHTTPSKEDTDSEIGVHVRPYIPGEGAHQDQRDQPIPTSVAQTNNVIAQHVKLFMVPWGSNQFLLISSGWDRRNLAEHIANFVNIPSDLKMLEELANITGWTYKGTNTQLFDAMTYLNTLDAKSRARVVSLCLTTCSGNAIDLSGLVEEFKSIYARVEGEFSDDDSQAECE